MSFYPYRRYGGGGCCPPRCDPCCPPLITSCSSPCSGGSGPAGPQGPQGPPGAGSIQHFASGTPGALTTAASGLADTGTLLGMGSSAPAISVAGGTISLAPPLSGLVNMAWSMPRNGTITAVSAYMSVDAALSLVGSTINVYAQVFQSPTPNDTFTPIAGTQTLVGSLTGTVVVGQTINGILTGLSIPVAPQTRLLMVFYSVVTGTPLVTTVTGQMSAGLAIS